MGAVILHPACSNIIQVFMLYSGHMIWNHILWEANQIVDRLAKHVLGIDINFYVYIFASDFIVLELRADLAQTCFPRGF